VSSRGCPYGRGNALDSGCTPTSHTPLMIMSSNKSSIPAGQCQGQMAPAGFLSKSSDPFSCAYEAYSEKSGSLVQRRDRLRSECESTVKEWHLEDLLPRGVGENPRELLFRPTRVGSTPCLNSFRRNSTCSSSFSQDPTHTHPSLPASFFRACLCVSLCVCVCVFMFVRLFSFVCVCGCVW